MSGNLIFSGNLRSSYTVTARSVNASYPIANVYDYWCMPKHYRAADATANDWLWKVDAGAGSTFNLLGIFLNWVNFTSIKLQYSDDDASWSDIATYTVPLNTITRRYQAYCAFPAASAHRFFRGFIPTGTTPIESPAVWRIGTIVLIENDTAKTLTLSENCSYPVVYSAIKPYVDTGSERISRSLYFRGEVSISFGTRSESADADLWTLSAMSQCDPVVLIENQGDIGRALLCLRDDPVQVSWDSLYTVSGNTLRFRELVDGRGVA